MDKRSEVRAFLSSRRAKITPERAGLPAYGKRRVAGLRRGEVAALAGVSVEYYTRLERGNLTGVSDSVLDALARALQLDDTEHAHLYDLARAAGPTRVRSRRRETSPDVRPTVRRLLDAMRDVPPFLRNHRFDILATNPLGEALYSPMFAAPHRPVNTARYVHRHGTKQFHHPTIGPLELAHEALELPGDTSLTIVTYTAEPSSPSEDSLKLLASWAAADQPQTTPTTQEG